MALFRVATPLVAGKLPGFPSAGDPAPGEWSRWNVVKLAVAPAWPGEAGRRSAAGHAANAGTNTSGAGGLYRIEAWGLIVL